MVSVIHKYFSNLTTMELTIANIIFQVLKSSLLRTNKFALTMEDILMVKSDNSCVTKPDISIYS